MLEQWYSGKVLHGVVQFLFIQPGFAAKFASYLRWEGLCQEIGSKEFLIHLLMRAKCVQLIFKTLIVKAWPVILTST